MISGTEIRKLALQTSRGVDTIYGMGGTTSINALTDEQIERISIREMKKVALGHIGIVGSTTPNHVEVKKSCSCTLCRNGVDLDRAGKAVCLRCNRGSKGIDLAIASVHAREAVERTIQRQETETLIKARSLLQLRGGRVRRGATVSPESMRIVKQAIKAELGKRGE
jgi:hypothetical protein